MGNSHAKHEEKKHAKKPPPAPTAAEECAAPGSAKAPASGSRLRDAYHVESKILGEGHYGTVRRCSPRGDATKRFAVKSINKSRVHRPEMLKREVEIMKAVRHPNIIEVVEVFDEPDFLHIVTELCRGGELFDRIIAKTSSREKHFSEADAVGILAQILEAVGYCHGLEPPVVHRDLKPENFLFVTEADDTAVDRRKTARSWPSTASAVAAGASCSATSDATALRAPATACSTKPTMGLVMP